jgi:hypothetical protein
MIIGLVLAISVIALITWDPTFKFSMHEDKINTTVNNVLPITKPVEIKPLSFVTFKWEGATGTIKTIDLDILNDSNKVQVTSNVSIAIPTKNKAEFSTIDFRVTGQGDINYQTGAFYVKDVKLEKHTVNSKSITEEHQALLDKFISAPAAIKDIKKSLFGILKKHGLTNKKEAEAMNEKTNKWMAGMYEAAQNMVKHQIESTPVYDLNKQDLKQKVAAMALKDISASHDSFHVVLSVGKFLSSALLKILLIVGIFVFVVGGFFSNKNRRDTSIDLADFAFSFDFSF